MAPDRVRGKAPVNWLVCYCFNTYTNGVKEPKDVTEKQVPAIIIN